MQKRSKNLNVVLIEAGSGKTALNVAETAVRKASGAEITVNELVRVPEQKPVYQTLTFPSSVLRFCNRAERRKKEKMLRRELTKEKEGRFKGGKNKC